MTPTHACVWIDHREAKIFAVTRDTASETVLHDGSAPKHIHRRADNVHEGKRSPDHAFFDDVAAALGSFKGILIAGPGTARTDFAGYLNETYPLLAKRVWGIEAMDHPTDHQLIAAVRKYFRAGERMHG